MPKFLEIHKGFLVGILIFLVAYIVAILLIYIMIKFLVTDIRDNKNKTKNDELESVHCSYFKSLFVKFNNCNNDCREIRVQKIDFLKTIFCENLSHARHIEMERMTFNSIYTVLIAGIFAFVNSNAKSAIVNELILFFSFFTGVILFYVSIRWKDVYNRHLLYAKVSYIYLKDMLFPDEKTVEMEGCSKYLNKEFELFDNEKVFSLYCFKPAHITEVVPECKHKRYLKTYQYFLILDILIEVMILIASMYVIVIVILK